MPRKSRKRLLRDLGVDEELARLGREEAYRRLEVELRRAWLDDRDPLASVTLLIQPHPDANVPADVAI